MGRQKFTRQFKRWFYHSLILGLVGLNLNLAAHESLEVTGWSLESFDDEKPSTWLGSDPVLGRLACPSLTRLNLHQQKSEPLVLKTVVSEGDPKHASWVFNLRSGIYWWSGEEVKAEELILFLKSNLSSIVREKGSGIWTLPDYEIQTESPSSIKIMWKKTPEFGPYIFNEIPLWRHREGNPDPSIKFECVGRYIPKKDGDSWVLSPNPKYGLKTQTLVLNRTRAKSKRSGFDFSMAESQETAIGKRDFLKTSPCSCLLDIPLISAVVWMDHNSLSQDKRKLLSSLFPREALLRTGAGYWGSLSSSVIPKNHPGYDQSLTYRKFSLTQRKNREPLMLSSVRGKVGLVEKIYADSLMASGFDVQFLPKEDTRVDGMITGLLIPWPSLDLFDSFHSKGKEVLGRRKSFSPELDKALEEYRVSLTHESPNFQALKKVHKLLYDLEWVSVLMQHQICLETVGLKKKTKIEVKDPDWFIDLLTQTGGVS